MKDVQRNSLIDKYDDLFGYQIIQTNDPESCLLSLIVKN